MSHCVASFTEAREVAEISPGSISVDRTETGKFIVTTKERGQAGTKIASIEIPADNLEVFALHTLAALGYTLKEAPAA